MGLQVAAAGKIINEFTGLAFAGGEFETDNPAIRFVSAEAWTRDAQGAHITFATAPVGTSSPVEGMRLTSEGILLVGTDTASGSAKLQVSGAINVSGITNAGTLALSATGANPVTLATNGSERARITSGGNVLIGTTTDAGGDSKLQLTVDDNVSLLIKSSSTAAKAAYAVFERSTTGNARRYWLGTGINSVADFSLYDSTNSVFRWSVTPAGNTIIGGSADGDYRLDVQSSGSSGTLRVFDQTATTGVTALVVRAGAGQSTTNLVTLQDNAGSGKVSFALTAGGDGIGRVIDSAGSVGLEATSTSSGGILGTYTNHALILQANSTERARITSDGVFTIANNSFVLTTAKTPSSASDTGTTGQIAWDSSFIYVATGTNTWKRAALTTW